MKYELRDDTEDVRYVTRENEALMREVAVNRDEVNHGNRVYEELQNSLNEGKARA